MKLSKKKFFDETFEEGDDVKMVYLFGKPLILITDKDIFQDTYKKEVYRDGYFPLKNYPNPFNEVTYTINISINI